MIWKILQAPYPAPSPTPRSFRVALGVGIFIGLFLLLFRPFGLHHFPGPYAEFKIFGYGLVTFIVVYFFQYLPRLIPQIRDQNWIVLKEIVLQAAMIMGIALGNVFYTRALGSQDDFGLLLRSMVFNTFILGVIPASFLVLISHNHLFRKYVDASQDIDPETTKPSSPTPQVPLQIQLPQEVVAVFPQQLLYIESLGNYARLVHQGPEQEEKQVVRSTLKQLEVELPKPHIIRCHRSYIVNLQQVEQVTGNAQGFKLQLKGTEERVPVSRKFVPLVRAYFAN